MPDKVTVKNIDHYKQNKISYILNDLEALGVDRLAGAKVLLARGVFKWLSVRRSLIKAKEMWKELETACHLRLKKLKGQTHKNNCYDIAYTRGFLAALRMCRADVRKLCHSPRWQAQDNDREAQLVLIAAQYVWCKNCIFYGGLQGQPCPRCGIILERE